PSVTENSALAVDGDGNGGGIYNTGTLTIRGGSSVTGNRTQDVLSGVNGNGGGIFNDGGTVTIEEGSQVSGNAALEDGGGIYNTGRVTIRIVSSTAGTSTTDEPGVDGDSVGDGTVARTVRTEQGSPDTEYGGRKGDGG